MGGKQSRVVETADVKVELSADGDQDGPTQTTITITEGLRDQIQELQSGGVAVQQEKPTHGNEQDALLKQQVRLAYEKGVEDARKRIESEKQRAQQTDSVKKAQLAREHEAREEARVQQLVAEINAKKYRAPLNDVQCSPEREACLKCYRDNQSNILVCKEVAEAFARCAQQTTEKFVKDD